MLLLAFSALASMALISAHPQQEVVEAGTDGHLDVLFGVEWPFKILETRTQDVPFVTTLKEVYKARISNEDEYFGTVSDFRFNLVSSSFDVPSYDFLNGTDVEAVTGFGTFNITGIFIGYTKVTITLYDVNDKVIGSGELDVSVLLSNVLWTQIYNIGISILIVLLFLNMGACLDIELIKRIIQKPVGPTIGLGCQYICMPLIAFGLGLVAFPDNNLLRLGLFASGCSPGGGLSNMWTHLLGGSLDLSIMMTFVSTVAALGMVPLWLLTLGPVILEGDYHIPYMNVVIGILFLVVPVFVGTFAQFYLPRAVTLMRRLVTPISVVNIIFILTVGVYANLYMFSYMTWKTLLAGFGQSLCGHIAGLLIALLFKRNTKEVIAISIETAVQNNAVGHVFLKLSIDAPAGDIAAVLPGCVFLLMPLPILIALLVKKLYMWKRTRDSILQNELNVKNIRRSTAGNHDGVSATKDVNGIDNATFENSA